MHFPTLLALAGSLIGLASAQANVQCLMTAEQVPMCGQACLTKAGSSYGCAFTDFACQCSHSAQINNAALTECVLSECSGNTATALAVASGAEAVCSCVKANAVNAPAVVTSTAAVPANTAAIGPVPAAATTHAAAATTSAVATRVVPTVATHAPLVSVSQFTGGSPNVVAGQVGGVLLGLLGAVAAL